MSHTRSLFKLPTLVDPKSFLLQPNKIASEGFNSNQSFIRITNATKKVWGNAKGMKVLKNWSSVSNTKSEQVLHIIKNEYIRDVVSLPLIPLMRETFVKMEEKLVNTTQSPEEVIIKKEYKINGLRGKKVISKGKDVLKKMD